ncbi:hypothetical protein BJX64DRAFT_292647 [Aspergillus heterothallicus]
MAISTSPLNIVYSRRDEPAPPQPQDTDDETPGRLERVHHRLSRVHDQVLRRRQRPETPPPPPPAPMSPSNFLFGVLLSYLDGTLELQSAIQDIQSGFTRPEYAAHLGPRNLMHYFTAFILHIAGQIPYDHEGHIRLAHLAHRLRDFDLFPTAVQWVRSPPFVGLRDPGDQEERTWRRVDQCELPNLHAFYARLSLHSNPATPPIFTIMTLRDLLEMKFKGLRDALGRLTDQDVLCAAQYILWAAHNLFNSIGITYEYSDMDAPFVAGSAVHPRPGLTLERWQYWRTSFRGVEYSQAYNSPATGLARRASNIMWALETNLDIDQPLAFSDNTEMPPEMPTDSGSGPSSDSSASSDKTVKPSPRQSKQTQESQQSQQPHQSHHF